MGAAAVAGGDGAAQPVGNGPGLAADVEGLAAAVQHDGDDAGVTAQGAQRGGGGDAAEVEAGGAGAVLQVLQPDVHVDVWPVSAGGGQQIGVGVVGDVAEHLGHRVGLALPERSQVVTGERGRFRVDDRGDEVVEGGVVEPALDPSAGPVGVAGEEQFVGGFGLVVVGFGPVLVERSEQIGAE
jgi:hypothetical protein